MSLITENNTQYYAGSQSFISIAGTGQSFTTTFDTNIVFGSYDPLQTNYALNNFKIYTAAPGDVDYVEYVLDFTVSGNTITITGNLNVNTSVVVQLKTETGGNYGDKNAYGDTVQENWGSYAYIKLNDIINNFLVAYVGAGKLIPSVKRTDLIFFAKRAMQEFSYDTLKSIKSQELTIPPNLSVPIPQDYVNYVKMSWVDNSGVKHIIYPTTLTSNPYRNPIQDANGIPTQDNFGNNIEGTSITDFRWDTNGLSNVNNNLIDGNLYWANGVNNGSGGGLYGLNPSTAQVNGWFTINERQNTFSFSNDLVDRLIILEYVSDGLAYDLDTKVPKMAEEAMYAYMSHAVLAARSNQPEYVINRLNREKVAKLRNAKIRLSNIKLEEISQVMRGKSKWIKH
jgi:hypothetical protein|tara:strand:+ start:1833 stop:3023 length:1191 start_codon:yes stop_codon:yes gene_type:complete